MNKILLILSLITITKLINTSIYVSTFIFYIKLLIFLNSEQNNNCIYLYLIFLFLKLLLIKMLVVVVIQPFVLVS